MDIRTFFKKIFTLDNLVALPGLSLFTFFFVVYQQVEFRGFLFSLLITTFIFTFLFLIVKKFRFKTANKFTKYFLLFVFLFNFAIFISIICQIFESEKDFKSYLAYTTDIEKAKEIQKLDKNIVIDKHSTNKEYGLKLWNCTTSCRDYFLIEISKLYPNNDEVNFPVDYIFSENLKTIKKEREKSLARIIKKIDGVYGAKVDIQNIEDKENAIVNIDVMVYEAADEKEIERIINNLIYYKIKRKININYDYDKDTDTYLKYKKRIHNLYNGEKYNEIDALLKEAKNLLPKDYMDSLYYYDDIWKKYNEIDKNIEKFPNNYKYYVERADVDYVPVISCEPTMFIKSKNLYYYEKALSLNPKAVELYEKAGDSACYGPDLAKVNFYYKKALKYSKNKDNIYAKLGDIYYSRARFNGSKEDYETALNYYNQIEDISGVIDFRNELKKYIKSYRRIILPEPELMVGSSWLGFLKVNNTKKQRVYWGRLDLYYKIFDCQRHLGQKEEAIKTCKSRAKVAEENGKSFNKFSNCYLKILLKN